MYTGSMLKKVGKNILCVLLEAQVRRLQKRNEFKIVAVAGSVGKTSAKLAVAKTLASNARVIYQDGNYNDRLTVPLVLFGRTEPSIFNVLAWLKLLLRNEQALRQAYAYDIAVLEIGTDHPGELEKFAYLRPDVVLITSIAVEHIEYFKTLDAIAQEELVPLEFSKTALLNIDDIAPEYLPELPYKSLSLHQHADYSLTKRTQNGLTGQQLSIRTPDAKLDADIALHGKPGAKAALAAAAVATELGWTADEISRGLEQITPVAGRMQVLEGIKDSTLIDDTYNASPLAVKAALDTLYGVDAPQRIAILGTMNELGDFAPSEHQAVGAYCDPTKLDLVVTIGGPAEDHLKPAAEAKGCKVKSFASPYDAGRFVKDQLQEGGVVLAKGSQNGVFAEEALKSLLKYPEDQQKLVRQSVYWLKRKNQQFPEK